MAYILSTYLALTHAKYITRHDTVVKVCEILFDLGLIEIVPPWHSLKLQLSMKQWRYRHIGMFRFIESFKN